MAASITKSQWEANNKVLAAQGIGANPVPKEGFAPEAGKSTAVTKTASTASVPLGGVSPISTPPATIPSASTGTNTVYLNGVATPVNNLPQNVKDAMGYTNSTVSTLGALSNYGNSGNNVANGSIGVGNSVGNGVAYGNGVGNNVGSGMGNVGNQLSGLSELINYLRERDAATTKKMEDYKSPYGGDIRNALSAISNWQNQKYNPSTDEALKVAQEQARLQTLNDMVKRGRVFDTYAAMQEQQAAQRLTPQYQQIFDQNQQNQFGNLINKLAAYSGAENQAFNQYNAGVGNTMAQNQFDWSKILGGVNTAAGLQNQWYNQGLQYANTYGYDPNTGKITSAEKSNEINRQVAQAPYTGQLFGEATQQAKELLRQQEKDNYGTELTPLARQSMTVYNNMPTNDPVLGNVRAEVANYYSDYAAEINRRTAVNPNDPLLPYLYAARNQKIISDPALFAKYGNDLAVSNFAVKQLSQSIDASKMKIEQDKIKAQLDNALRQVEIDKGKQDVEKVKQDIEVAKAEVDKMNWEAAYKKVETSLLPAIKKSEINSNIALASQRYASASESSANIALRNEQVNTEKAQQTKYLADAEKTAREINQNTPALLSASYSNFLESGLTPDQWLLKKNDTNGYTNAQGLNQKDLLKDFISLLKTSNKYPSEEMSRIDALLK